LQEGRRLAVDEGFEEPGVVAAVAQAAGLAGLLRRGDAGQLVQCVSEGSAQHGALVGRELGGLLGA
jgi:hypothetical protein